MNYRATGLVLLGLTLCIGLAHAQGVTTGALSGVVTDTDNAALPGVDVSAVHQPTGTRYTAITDPQGRFRIQNVRVGGPYAVSISLEGFHPQEATDVYVSLGEETRLTFKLQLETVTETVTVVGESNPLISPSRTGAASNVVTETIENLPTISRGLEDFARLNPFMTVSGENEDQDAISVAGRSSRYNNIQIDGAVNNDLFGLADSGTPGGQTETTPISLDAIAEFQLVLADFDVRNGGFSGGSINAITRSGSNRHRGSVFYFTRDDDMVGDGPQVLGEPGAFDEEQYGFRIGGPITQDAIFYFVNGEISRKDQPTGWSLDGSSGSCFVDCAPEAQAAADRFVSLLSQYGFDPGGRAEQVKPIDSDKFFGRLDFNIGDQHQLTLRHNYVDASNLINRPGSFSYEWDSEAYLITDETNSTVAQLNSVFGAAKFNEARLTYQTISDRRRGIVTFPWVEIEDIDPANGFFQEFEAGTEPFSTRNALDQDVLEINNDFTWILGDHTLTLGTHNELFTFDNLFIQNAFGSYEFRNLDEFETGIAREFEYTIVNPGQAPNQEFDVNQIGLYAGDQWAAKPNLTLNFGLRVDIPYFPDEPSRNPFTEETYGVRTDEIPDGEQLWQPRLGFNWDINSDGQQQLRGGAGIFAGRTPYVWISNQYARTGIEQSFIRDFSGIQFNPDPFSQEVPPGTSLSGGEFNLIDPEFQFPQVLRVNLAYDRQLPWWNLVGSVEAILAQSQEEIDYKDLNLARTGEVVPFDGRPIFERVDSRTSGAYFITNTSKGEQTNFAIKLERPYRRGVWGYVSYTWGESKVVNEGSSSRAVSNFQFNEAVDPNNAGESTSDFEVEHRFNASVSYRFNADTRWPTTVSGYYNLQSGRPYGHIYGSQPFPSINADRYFSNDLVYVPAGPGDVELENGTWEDLDRFIRAESCLDNSRGGIAPRNGCVAPWNHTLDVRLAQDIPIRRSNLQITLDILNFLNLLDDDTGTLRYANFNTLSEINLEGITDDGRPIYSLSRVITDPQNNDKFETHSVKSRWRAKLGLRWTF